MPSDILARFRVDGRPRTKGSLKAYCVKNRTHTVRVEEQTTDSARWRRMVALAAQADQKRLHGKLLGYPHAVEVRMVCYFDRTLSVARDAAPGEIIPSHQTPFPTDVMLGDADKLARNVGDALTDSRLILDDSQIVDFLVGKRWATVDHPAGAEIMVMAVGERNHPPFWGP